MLNNEQYKIIAETFKTEINRVKFCPYRCKDGVTVYQDQEGYDCPAPCPNCGGNKYVQKSN